MRQSGPACTPPATPRLEKRSGITLVRPGALSLNLIRFSLNHLFLQFDRLRHGTNVFYRVRISNFSRPDGGIHATWTPKFV